MPTPDGRISLKVPPARRTASSFVCAERARRLNGGGKKGDLLARVRSTSTKLSKAEREAIENLQKASNRDVARSWDVIDDRPRYMISIAAELVGMHPQTLRVYETKGLVRPRHAREHRLYSEADLERLRLIQRLTGELGLNLAGVETVLRLEDELGRLRARLARLEARCARRSSASTGSTAARSCSTAIPTRPPQPTKRTWTSTG